MPKSSIAQTLRRAKLPVQIALAAALILIGWGVYEVFFAKSGSSGGGPRGITVAVETAPINRGPIQDLGLFSGTLIPKTSFTVATKVSGKVRQLLVDIGDTVRQGQLVAVLEDEEYRQQVIQAEADLRVAQANLAEAKSSMEMINRELERIRSLHAKGYQSDSQLDTAVSRYEAQEAQYKVTQAQEANRTAALETAKLRLSYTQIRASWERGSSLRYVGERFVTEGSMLSTNGAIMSIIELHPITAVIFVSDRDSYRLEPGQETAILSSAFLDDSFIGKVARMSPMLNETSRQARVEIEIQNPDGRLKPGMFITAQVEYVKKDDAVLVPVGSIVQRNGKSGIFLADKETRKAVFVPIRTGITAGDWAEIVDPLPLTGDVVTLGQHLLEDGTGLILPQVNGEPDIKKPAGKPVGKQGPGGKP
ncbi:MAG: efflux RND transporter periplasmic adaptor subunit [Candidatus Aminicenantes bacterium]|nr:efflux RND transporter periplasmic adaptor subunit [Candidatus Aminicenantes bacterium]